jgi:hypothetical protein
MSMKAQAKLAVPDVERPDAPMRAATGRPSVDAQLAANDELVSKKRETAENPLWAINVAMAGFFIVTALVMMFS